MANRRRKGRERSARSLELEAARKVERTRLGIACGLIGIVTGVLVVVLTMASLHATQVTFRVFARDTVGSMSPLLLTFILGGGLCLGGLGLLVPATWGWWLAMACAALGPLDIFRIYRNLYGAINWDHPNADEVLTKLVVFGSVPAMFYVGLGALLLQRTVRETYRISS